MTIEPSPYRCETILMCPCPPNKNGFCTIPSKCIAKRMIEQDMDVFPHFFCCPVDCDMVCKAMQELCASHSDIQSAERVLDEFVNRLLPYFRYPEDEMEYSSEPGRIYSSDFNRIYDEYKKELRSRQEKGGKT